MLNSSTTEADLSNKAASILRTRLGKAKLVPSPALTTMGILEQIHGMARKAPNADFSGLCSVCSLYIFRVISSTSASTAEQQQKQALEIYAATLRDYLERKASTLHPPFIVDFIRRFPASAFPLATDILEHLDVEGNVKVYRQVQAYGMLQVFSQQLGAIAKTVPLSVTMGFLQSFVSTAYALLKAVAAGSAGSEGGSDSHGWNAQRLKDVVKVALHLARTSKSVVSSVEYEATWNVEELRSCLKALKEGDKTGPMKGVQGMVEQMIGVLQAGSKSNQNGATANGMERADGKAARGKIVEKASSKGKKADGKEKKRKSEGKEKEVKNKKRKSVENGKE